MLPHVLHLTAYAVRRVTCRSEHGNTPKRGHACVQKLHAPRISCSNRPALLYIAIQVVNVPSKCRVPAKVIRVDRVLDTLYRAARVTVPLTCQAVSSLCNQAPLALLHSPIFVIFTDLLRWLTSCFRISTRLKRVLAVRDSSITT